MSALLALGLFLAPAQDDEGKDLFQWARDLDNLDLTWQWGDFGFAFSGEADLEFFAFGKEAPGVHVEDSALRADRYKRGRFADSPEAAGRLQAFLDGSYREFLDCSIRALMFPSTAVVPSSRASIEKSRNSL